MCISRYQKSCEAVAYMQATAVDWVYIEHESIHTPISIYIIELQSLKQLNFKEPISIEYIPYLEYLVKRR